MALTTNQISVGLLGVAAGGYKATVDSFIGSNGVNAAADFMLSMSKLNPQFLGKAIFSDAQFAAALTKNFLSATSADVQAGVSKIVEDFMAANATYSRGAVAVAFMDALVAVPAADPVLGASRKAFVDKVALADAYTGTSTDMAVLEAAVGTTSSIIAVDQQLTTKQDILTGTAGADTFIGRIIDNANTLQNGDVINGGAGMDILQADIGNSQEVVIAVETTGIEQVVIRAQAVYSDTSDNNMMSTADVQIDAEDMDGVTHWESNNSRADLVIEDVRIQDNQKTKDITIAMVETDPGHVDFGVYFDQYSLRSQSVTTSSLTLELLDTRSEAAGTGPLKDNPYNGFGFLLNGKEIVIQSAAIDDALTYDALLAAIQAQLNAVKATTPELAGVSATKGEVFTAFDTSGGKAVTGTQIILTDAAGGVISLHPTIGWATATGTVPPSSGLHTVITKGTPNTLVDLVTSKVILDDVGRGSTGGDLVIGGLSVGDTSTSRGVERFEIEVRDNSKLQTINSTNNTLKEITIVNGTTSSHVVTPAHSGVPTAENKGNLTVNGTVGGGVNAPGANNALASINTALPGTFNQHNGFGFSDVRLIDGSAMTGELAFTAEMSSRSINKYLNLMDTAARANADNIAVVYSGGANDDTLSVTLDFNVAGSRSTIVSGREDFTFTFNGNAGDDAITVNVADDANGGYIQGGRAAWYTNQKLNANITVNAGDGNDTIKTPGAGDVVINAGAGNDTIYADNTGAQNLNASAQASASLAAAAYKTAEAAELAAALAANMAADASNVVTTAAVLANLAILDAAIVLTTGDAAVTAATTAAVTARAITAAQKTALDTAYASVAAGTVDATELAAGDTLLATIKNAALAADAAAKAADAAEATHDALLNATQNAVVNATVAVNGLAGSATKVDNLTALQAAIVVGTTDAAVGTATTAAVNNGAILAANKTAIDAAAISAGAGTVDAAELAAVVALISPLQAAAAAANTVAGTTLSNAIKANNDQVDIDANSAAVDPVNGNGIAGAFVGGVFVPAAQVTNIGSTEANAAATAAATAATNAAKAASDAATKITNLEALKALIVVGALDHVVANATAAAVTSNAITAAEKLAIDAAAGTGVAGAVVAGEKTAVDALFNGNGYTTGLLTVAKADSADKAIRSTDAAAISTATTKAAYEATVAAAAGGNSLNLGQSKAVFVLNTANQSAVAVGSGYDLITNDERNLADIKSDVSNSYNLSGASLTVNFKGIEAKVTVASDGYKTTDLQINQAIKDAISGNAVLSKLIEATDGPANSLIVTSLIDGVMNNDSLSITLATPTTLTQAVITGAAAAYSVAATQEAVLAAMNTAKASFDTKGDYVDQFAETGAAAGNAQIVGANSTTTSDNTINGGAGNDVIVLGTTEGGNDMLTSSNDIVKFDTAFGNDTVVHFDATGYGADQFDFRSLGGDIGTGNFNTNTADKSITVVSTSPATTIAAVEALFAANNAAAQTHVYVSVNTTTNIGSVYGVVDAIGANTATATLMGTIDLADTLWSTLTADNFM